MSLSKELEKRSGATCELCGATENLSAFEVAPSKESIAACKVCIDQIENPDTVDANHWRCLNDSMWSEVPAVQVVAWRMLTQLRAEGWPQDLLDMMYLEEETLEWAKATGIGAEEDENAVIHRDVNGVVLQAGDSVVLIKDLKVKGSSMVAKQGTAVRRISLDPENEKYIEGKVGPTQIVIITDYVKKM
ncbi:PhnA domain-containing protein [Lutibacter sp. A64]|uniref:PhnA domain-containing protein n=1 Tax=Lutibacter sp. A64 TaxID=2918526 RepID=UPI001F06935F|nr:alkylphosphonate utilization protein [Lutibacter sp. A64]UMB55455.1 PhnA domain-containing protein [Lutibacter sp. A64]